MVLLVTGINANSLLFKNHMHWLLFYVTPAISPRMLICVDSEGEPVAVTVRVGQVSQSQFVSSFVCLKNVDF